jgi:signal transduction histidine kinase
MKLSHRVLLLVTVPLLCELCFVFVFYRMLQNVEEETRREVHAREILDHSNNVLNSYYEISTLMGNILLRHNFEEIKLINERAAYLQYHMQQLQILWQADRPEIAEAIARLQTNTRKVLDVTLSGLQEIARGNVLPGLALLDRARPALDHLSGEIWAVSSHAHDVLRQSLKVQAEEREELRLVLWTGIIFNIVAVIGIALAFNRSIVTRLAFLIENTYSLAEGKTLHPRLQGNDEIAELDRIFHETASILETSRGKEKELLTEMQVIMESIPVGLAILDDQGKVIEVNGTLRRMLQAGNKDTFADLVLADLVKPGSDDGPPVQGAGFKLSDILAAQSADTLMEGLLCRRSEAALPVAFSISSMKRFGRISYLLVLLDIAERKELEKRKRDFMAMVTHDLRTPLASSQIFLEMLENNMYQTIHPENCEKAKELSATAARLMGLINDLLDIEKLESGRLTLSKGLISVDDLFREAAENAHEAAFARGVAIDWDVAEDWNLSADCERLSQAFGNIVSDAINAAPPASVVYLRARRPGNDLMELSISCRERFLSAGEIECMFDRFKYLSKAGMPTATDTGVRLAIAKVIVEQHGGKVLLASSSETGTTFCITLPLVKTAATALQDG